MSVASCSSFTMGPIKYWSCFTVRKTRQILSHLLLSGDLFYHYTGSTVHCAMPHSFICCHYTGSTVQNRSPDNNKWLKICPRQSSVEYCMQWVSEYLWLVNGLVKFKVPLAAQCPGCAGGNKSKTDSRKHQSVQHLVWTIEYSHVFLSFSLQCGDLNID